MQDDDVQTHYKALYFWASVGDTVMAGKYRRLLCERFLRSDGDFRTAEDFKGIRAFPSGPRNRYLYSNGWILVAMQRMGAYDIVRKGLQFVLQFQDENQGGFYSSFNPKSKTIVQELMDSSSTSSAGLALLACGRMCEARRAGDFLVRLFDLQPQPEKYFFCSMRPDGTLHARGFSGDDLWDANGRKQMCLSAEADGMGELTWMIGKPTKFLVRLYGATGETKYLDCARRGFDFFQRLHPGAWTNLGSCKTMWAGAELYRMTGEDIFAETTLRILDHICKSQLPSGAWLHSLWYKTESDQPFAVTVDVVSEFGSEISDVLYEFSAR